MLFKDFNIKGLNTQCCSMSSISNVEKLKDAMLFNGFEVWLVFAMGISRNVDYARLHHLMLQSFLSYLAIMVSFSEAEQRPKNSSSFARLNSARTMS
jgi:hypothetical protein